MPRTYLTTPIYYVNDRPHIGHAYTTLACDVLARFKRLDGHDVFFLTGTDEHGQKVEKAAQDAGMDPQAFTDQVSQHFRDLADRMDFSNDDFIRTTEAAPQARPARRCGSGWSSAARSTSAIMRAGTRCATRPSTGRTSWSSATARSTRPAARRWNGCGSRATSSACPPGRTGCWTSTSATRTSSRPPRRRNEVISFVKAGLQDLSISRTSFTWGVPVPGDAEHVMYVWLDALTNYITAARLPG